MLVLNRLSCEDGPGVNAMHACRRAVRKPKEEKEPADPMEAIGYRASKLLTTTASYLDVVTQTNVDAANMSSLLRAVQVRLPVATSAVQVIESDEDAM